MAENIINFEKHHGNAEIELPLIGDSLCSQYIPFVSLFNGTTCKKEENGKKVLIYNLKVSGQEPTLSRGNSFTIRKLDYQTLLTSLITNNYLDIFLNEKTEFQAGKGMLVEYNRFTNNYRILMLLAVRQDYLWSINKDSPDKTKFVIFINKDFETDEAYSSIYKRVYKDYVENSGIDVIYTNDITRWCYKYSFNKPKFKNIKQMVDYLDSLNDVVNSEILSKY